MAGAWLTVIATVVRAVVVLVMERNFGDDARGVVGDGGGGGHGGGGEGRGVCGGAGERDRGVV